MNSTELYIGAGDAIAEWLKTHNAHCMLSIENKKVVCKPPPNSQHLRNDPLYITKFEMNKGMEQRRWNSIGSALHNLFCKETACRTHRKH